jgi:RNA polymerase sigma-70 factor (ECF subfamily)
VVALRDELPNAPRVLFQRYAPHVRRVLIRVLGLDREVPDLVQDVFLVALRTIDKLDEPEALKAWLTAIAVYQARALIRKRARRKILRFVPTSDLDTIAAPVATMEVTESVRALYAVLDELPADDRIAFALRFVDGMDLREIGEACGVSRATVSRRLARARDRFIERARDHEALADWLGEGRRWVR